MIYIICDQEEMYTAETKDQIEHLFMTDVSPLDIQSVIVEGEHDLLILDRYFQNIAKVLVTERLESITYRGELALFVLDNWPDFDKSGDREVLVK